MFVRPSLLIGCGEPQVYYSEQVSDQDSQKASLMGPPRVCLRIGEGFSPAEQDRILAAVARENLRASVQFDFAPQTSDVPRPGSWTLLKPHDAAATGGAAHVTERFPQGGGAIDLDVDRMQAGDLQKAIEAAGITLGSDLRCESAESVPHTAAVPHHGPM